VKISDEIRKCVFFICVPKTLINGTQGVSFVGTGFFVGVELEGLEGLQRIFLVTAKHVAEKLANKQYLIRLNNKTGGSNYIQGGGTKWFYHPTDNAVDVAVIPYAPSAQIFDYKAVPTKMFLTDEIVKENKIGIGDDVVITGLFAHACGSQRNQPIVRMGNVALISDEPLPTDSGNMEAYLIESRSISGLSGSPAFVYESTIGRRKIYLLGLMHGHWDIAPELKNDQILDDEIFGKVNMGIAIVVPAKKILEVINQPDLARSSPKMEK
jgi:hypothetical protein